MRSLAEQLQSAGVKTYLDQWDLRFGMNVPQWIEESIASSDYILLVCTPKFAERANSMKGGVGQEKVIITGEMYYRLRPQTSFVPLLREGNPPSTAIPRYLGANKWADFRSGENFASEFEELLRHIYKSPKFTKPPLGTKPVFLQFTTRVAPRTSQVASLAEVYELSEIAQDWESANRAYHIVERLSDALKGMIRHPPIDMAQADEPLRSFLLLAGLHYGGNWLHWLGLNLRTQHALPTMLTALSVSYDRVRFRAFYGLQFIDTASLISTVNDASVKIGGNTKDIINRFVIPKSVMSYLKEVAQSVDNRLADKARAVIREIENFGPDPIQ